MSAEGEKTEMPTAKRLRDARQKGQVCLSREVVSVALLVALMYLCAVLSAFLADDVERLVSFVVGASAMPFDDAVRLAGWQTVRTICWHSFAFVLVAAVVGVASSLVQTGLLFTFEPLKPSAERISPAKGFGRVFSRRNFFEFAKNVVKVVFLGYLLYRLVISSLGDILPLCYGTAHDLLPVVRTALARLAAYTAFGYVAIAVADRFFQRRDFLRQMMMTKDEVRREYRETEGTSEVRQARQQLRREILLGTDPVRATRESDVVVTNPTHLAVGIRYRADEAPLPQITVKGADRIAALIRRTAMEAGIPILEDIPLARRIYAEAKAEEFIPVSLVKPVVEVLMWVKRLNEAKREEAELESVDV